MPETPAKQVRELRVSGVPIRETTLTTASGNVSVFYTAFGIALSARDAEEGAPFDGQQSRGRLVRLLEAAELLPTAPLSPAYQHPDRRFRGPAYRYLRPEDRLPTYEDLPGSERVIAKVRLFHPLSGLVYYVVAVTDYSGQLVLSGFQIGPLLGSSFGDSSMQELATFRSPLPIERDLGFEPRRLSEIIEETHAREASERTAP
jgi:hypothetical protein